MTTPNTTLRYDPNDVVSVEDKGDAYTLEIIDIDGRMPLVLATFPHTDNGKAMADERRTSTCARLATWLAV